MANLKQKITENNIKIRSFTNLIGVGLLFVAGLYFVLFIDLYVKFRTESAKESITPIAIWLFLAIIFAVGAGILYFFGDSNKHRKVLTIILKAHGIYLSLCYIVYIFIFKHWINTSGKVITDTIASATTTAIISLIINCIALVFIIINFIFSIKFLDEEY